MTWVLGETVSESFSTGATGETFTRTASYVNGSSSIWNPTFSELGAGYYRYSYTPLVAGAFEWAGSSSGGSPVVINFDVEATGITPVVAAASTGGLTQTLAQLRLRVADRMGDLDPLTATSNGTTTTFIDVLNINTATENPVGRMLYTSDGTAHRITSWVDTTNTLTFVPAAGSTSYTASGQSAYLFNKRGQGFPIAAYARAINAAINDAFPLGLIEVRSTISPAFTSVAPEVTVPANMTYVYMVEFEDADSYWHAVPKATMTNENGWRPDAAAGQLRILGRPGANIDALTIRLTGYGRQDVLSADSDTCALNAEYVVSRACYHLALGALDKDQMYGQMVQVFQKESERMRTRLRTIKRVGSELVRSI